MKQLSMYKIIEKKKKAKQLTKEDIDFFIDGVVNESIPNYQTTALLMAIDLMGMSAQETAWLTSKMLYSGRVVTFKGDEFVDKHSTGGIGDKASLILGPIAAACGVKVPMIAGRGLGHTGGTIDKLESIPGFKTKINLKQFQANVIQNGLCIIGQTKEIAPADGKIYALRDVTATIDNIPLITASIMSKKLAEGANGLVFDIKIGNGAFMKNKAIARKLSKSIIDTATRFDKKAVTLLTDMNQPLGRAVGHSNEIIECIEVLKGNFLKEDLAKLSIELASYMILFAQKATSLTKARKMAKNSIDNGDALKKFKEIIELQGGDSNCLTNYDLLKIAPEESDILAPSTGYIKSFQNKEIGYLLIELGGGRKTQKQKIDHQVGIYFHKKVGDYVKKGEKIATINHHKNQKNSVELLINKFIDKSVKLSASRVDRPTLIYDIYSNQKI